MTVKKATKAVKKASKKPAARKPAAKKSPAKKPSPRAAKLADIIPLILEHHKPLKKLIKVLKDEDLEKDDKEDSFEEFAPLLLAHAKPEAEALYEYMKAEDELRVEGYEGETEHAIAERLIKEIKACTNDDQWNAKVKVLAEVVEHHIEEEEEEMLPDVKKNSTPEDREELAMSYTKMREDMLEAGGEEE